MENASGFDSPFIPMSVLKQIRRSYYGAGDVAFENTLDRTSDILHEDFPSEKSSILPPRTELGLWDKVVTVGGNDFLPLSPVMFEEETYLSELDARLAQNPDLIVGLNNIAQVLWAKSHPETRFFADVFLYTQNSYAYGTLKDALPSLIGSYELNRNTGFNYVGDDYTPPLFISRVCLRHNGLDYPCKGCSRNNIFHLQQNGKNYKAICRNCITVITRN